MIETILNYVITFGAWIPVQIWYVLGGILCLMAITLLLSILFNRGDGTVVMTTYSPLYIMRYIIHYPLGVFLSIVYKDAVINSLGNRYYSDHLDGYIRSNGSITITHHSKVSERFHPATHNIVIKETSLCGAFWKSMLSLVIILPLDLVMAPFVGIFLLIVIAGGSVIAVGATIGGIVVTIWKTVIVPFGKIIDAFENSMDRYSQKWIDDYFSELDRMDPKKALEKSMKYRVKKRDDYDLTDLGQAINLIKKLFKKEPETNLSYLFQHYGVSAKLILDRYVKYLTPEGKDNYLALCRKHILNKDKLESLRIELKDAAAKSYKEYEENLQKIVEDYKKTVEEDNKKEIRKREVKEARAIIWKNRWEYFVKFYNGWLCPKVKFVQMEKK